MSEAIEGEETELEFDLSSFGEAEESTEEAVVGAPQQVETPETDSTESYVEDSEDTGTSKYPDTYASILDEIPVPFRDTVAAQLKEWDKGTNQRFRDIHAEYESFKPLKEQGFDADMLQAGATIYNNVQNNPVEVYNHLRQSLIEQGMIPDEAAQVAQQEVQGQQQQQQQGQSQEDEQDPAEFDPLVPQIEALQQQIQELTQGFTDQQTSQQQQQIQRQAEAELQGEFNTLEKSFGKMSPAYKQELASRAHATEMRTGRSQSLEEAHRDNLKFASGLNNSRKGPRIPPGGSGTPAPEDYDLSDDTQRKEAATALVKRMISDG